MEVKMKGLVTIKIWQETRQALKILAAQRNTTMLVLLDQLIRPTLSNKNS